MTTIFLSYATDDRAVADDVRYRLWERGYEDVIRDDDRRTGVRGGRDWERWIYRNVVRCDALVFLLTERSISSRWCLSELAIAHSLGIDVIAVVAQPEPAATVVADFAGRMLAIRWHEPGAADRTVSALADAGHQPMRPLPPSTSPYPGLAGFDETRHAVFFGRPQKVRDVVSAVEAEPGTGYGVAVVGPSGVGKSSLVIAGVLPQLRRNEGFRVFPPLVPGEDPVEDLRTTVGVPEAGPDIRTSLDIQMQSSRVSANTTRVAVVTVDQAERLLTVADPTGREEFVALLRSLMAETALKVLLTFRSEYLGHDEAAALGRLHAQQIDLMPMTRAERREVITQPARRAGLLFEPPALVERLLDDSLGANSLPLLAYALQRLWEDRTPDGRLTEASYEAAGGVERALVREANLALTEATDDLEALASPDSSLDPAASALRELVGFALPTEPGRPVAARDLELLESNERVLRPFINRHLLQSVPHGDATLVRVAHESFLTAWPPLREALESEAERVRFRREVELAAQSWQARTEDDPDELLYGNRLGRAFAEYPAASAPIDTYLAASETADRLRRRQRLNAAVIKVLAGVAAALSVLAGVLALRATDRADDATDAAEVSSALRLVADADRLRSSALDEAAGRAVQAFDARPDLPSTRGGLLDVLTHAPGPTAFVRQGTAALTIGTGFVIGDEVWAASAGSGLVPLTRGPEPVRADLTVRALDLTPDEAALVAATDDGIDQQIVVIDPRSWTTTAQVEIDSAARTIVATDGGHVAWVDFDDVGWWWPAGAAPKRIGRLEGALRIAATQSGCLAHATAARLVITPTDSCPLASETSIEGRITALDGHPSEDRMVLARDDGAIVELDLADSGTPRTLARHGPGVRSIAYTSNGSEIVSGGTDRTIRTWVTDASSIPSRPPLSGHRHPVGHVAASVGGDIIVSTEVTTGDTVVWDHRADRSGLAEVVAVPETLGAPFGVYRADDGTVWIHGGSGVGRWTGSAIDDAIAVTTSRMVVIPATDTDDPGWWVVAYDPARGNVMTIPSASGIGRLELPPLPTDAAIDVVPGRPAVAAARPDGTVCVAVRSAPRARCALPNQTDSETDACGPPRAGPVSIAVSPSGAKAAVGHVNGRISILDLGSLVHVACRDAPEGGGQVNHLEWLDEDTLAVADDLRIVWVVDAASESLSVVRSYTGHTDSVLDLDRLGESTLLSSAEDGTVRLWDLPSGEAVGGSGLAFERITTTDPEIRVESVVATSATSALSVQRGIVTAWTLDPTEWRTRACELAATGPCFRAADSPTG